MSLVHVRHYLTVVVGAKGGNVVVCESLLFVSGPRDRSVGAYCNSSRARIVPVARYPPQGTCRSCKAPIKHTAPRTATQVLYVLPRILQHTLRSPSIVGYGCTLVYWLLLPLQGTHRAHYNVYYNTVLYVLPRILRSPSSVGYGCTLI